jgi:4-aminobutyrate aminotransferase-like enzyme
MIAVELVKSKKTKTPAIKEADEVLQRAFIKGLILLHAGGSCVRIIPPLTITKQEFEKGLEILADILKGI